MRKFEEGSYRFDIVLHAIRASSVTKTCELFNLVCEHYIRICVEPSWWITGYGLAWYMLNAGAYQHDLILPVWVVFNCSRLISHGFVAPKWRYYLGPVFLVCFPYSSDNVFLHGFWVDLASDPQVLRLLHTDPKDFIFDPRNVLYQFGKMCS